MRDKKLKLVIQTISLTLLFIVILILKRENISLKRQCTAAIDYSSSIDNLYQNVLDNAYELQKANWTQSIFGVNREIILTNNSGSELNLGEQLNGYTLLFYFDSDMCSPCLNRELENVKTLSQTYRELNLVVLVKDHTSNYLFNDSQFSGLESNIFITKQSPFRAGKLTDTPVLALLQDKKELFMYHAAKDHNRYFTTLLQIIDLIKRSA